MVGMCMICDGYSEEDVRRVIELNIITHGWHLLGVTPSGDEPDGPTWTYTIGMAESHALPELVVTDLHYEKAARFLNWVGAQLVGGRSITDLAEHGIGWAPVHDIHLGGELFCGWFDYYRTGPEDPTFVQLFPRFEIDCPSCPDFMADLSNRDELFPANRP